MKDYEKAILQKIRIYAAQAIQFKEDMDFETFSSDIKTTSACVFNLFQIGELVGKLDDEFIDDNSQIPWRKIKGLRNRIAHGYEDIKLNIVWDVIIESLPELIKQIDIMDVNSLGADN